MTINNITGQWIGDIRGTDIGNAYFEVTKDNSGNRNFELRTNVAGAITIFDASIDPSAQNSLKVISRPSGTQNPITGLLTFDEVSAAKLSGRWSLSTGNSGVIWLTPANTQAQTTAATKPVELVAKEASLPNFVIYRRELEAIVSRLSQTIPSPAQVVITAELDGNDVTQFADVFLKRTDLPNSLRHLKLNISDSGQPFARSIFFVISNREGCRFNVQSDDRTWTNGAYASLLELSNRYVSKGLVLFQRYGLNLNGLIFLAALVMLPSLPIVPRIIFLFGVIALLFAFKRLHDSFIRTRVYLDDRTRFTLMREYPAILSAVIASAIIGLVSLLFKALSSNEPFSWLFYLFPR